MKEISCTPAPHAPVPLPGVVALVDDDLQIGQALSTWFKLGGLQTAHHSSSESLLQAITQMNGHPTLPSSTDPSQRTELVAAVLDLNLPGMSGFALASALRERFPRLPLVIITALREDERTPYGAAPWGITCLQKPFDLDALDDALFPAMHANMFDDLRNRS